MKIAQVAPLYESVPPKYYGGTERVVSYLTEELVRQGHNVTLFASGDSVTKARLVPGCERSLRLDESCLIPLAHHVVMLEQLFEVIHSFDVIHFHLDYLHYPLSKRYGIAHVTTLHGRLDLPDLVPLYREFHEMPVVSISNAQRKHLPWLNWQGTVHHGVPKDLYSFGEGAGKYLAFLGRISIEKRVDHAVEIAKRTGMKLKIAAKVDPTDREYYESHIKPLVDNPLVEFIGEIGEREKQEFLGGAYALVFPIDWPEPFGLVMIEALACGTPVIAYRCGSVPEVLEDGVSGFIVGNVDQAVEAVGKIAGLSRKACRRVFEERFTAERMARDYVAVYQRIARNLEAPTKEQVLQLERESTTVLDGL